MEKLNKKRALLRTFYLTFFSLLSRSWINNAPWSHISHSFLNCAQNDNKIWALHLLFLLSAGKKIMLSLRFFISQRALKAQLFTHFSCIFFVISFSLFTPLFQTLFNFSYKKSICLAYILSSSIIYESRDEWERENWAPSNRRIITPRVGWWEWIEWGGVFEVILSEIKWIQRIRVLLKFCWKFELFIKLCFQALREIS